MKIEELRIGNLVMYGNINAPVIIPEIKAQVKAITLFGELDFSTPQLDITVPAKHCSGIPLTPEILEKAGFVKDGFKSYCVTLPKTLQTHETKLSFSGDYLYLVQTNRRKPDDYITVWNKDIMKEFCLHSLQNLYFCLCGSELQFIHFKIINDEKRN